MRLSSGIVCALMLATCAIVQGQNAAGPDPGTSGGISLSALPDAPQPQSSVAGETAEAPPVTLRNTPLHILKDQAAIWSSPARVRDSDLPILVPLVLGTTVLVTTDHQVMNSSKLQNASLNNEATAASWLLQLRFTAWAFCTMTSMQQKPGRWLGKRWSTAW